MIFVEFFNRIGAIYHFPWWSKDWPTIQHCTCIAIWKFQKKVSFFLLINKYFPMNYSVHALFKIITINSSNVFREVNNIACFYQQEATPFLWPKQCQMKRITWYRTRELHLSWPNVQQFSYSSSPPQKCKWDPFSSASCKWGTGSFFLCPSGSWRLPAQH